ncbi:MAG: PilZ domain-containing protein [Thermoanaerobaculia bacterium]|nr:PilZ domain-containing protein [Thermoanaerobaculia bacterium]
MSRENRRHKRYEVQDVEGRLAYNVDAKVLNISLTGMAIETRTMLQIGGDYWLRIPQEDGSLRVKADVKWCHLVGTTKLEDGEVVPQYKAGIDFRSILEDKAREMLDFIEKNVIVELDQRLFGRFHLEEDETVDLDADAEFAVRKISLSGMLIETEFVPELDQVLDLELRTNGVEPVIEARARVAHVDREAAGADRIQVGVEFQDLSDEAREKIEHIIEGMLE